jgi:hypothetical protein
VVTSWFDESLAMTMLAAADGADGVGGSSSVCIDMLYAFITCDV